MNRPDERQNKRNIRFEPEEDYEEVDGTPYPGREWRIKHAVVGVRLVFRDAGDETWTNAGVFVSMDDAREEARRQR